MLMVVMSSGVFRIINLGFIRLCRTGSSSSLHFSFMSISSASASSFLLVVINTLPSVSVLSELIPTFMPVGLILAFSISLIASADKFPLDLTVILKCRCGLFFSADE